MKILGGRPLVSWILDSIIQSGVNKNVWVATDSDKVERYIQEAYPHVGIYRRCSANSTDVSPIIDLVLEFLNFINTKPENNLVLAQATSPFTPKEDFQILLNEMSREDVDSYVSCVRLKKFLWSEYGHPLTFELAKKPRRQDYKGILVESGSFYASRVGSIIESGQLLSGKIKVIESNAKYNIEIDEPADWILAESIADKIIN